MRMIHDNKIICVSLPTLHGWLQLHLGGLLASASGAAPGHLQCCSYKWYPSVKCRYRGGNSRMLFGGERRRMGDRSYRLSCIGETTASRDARVATAPCNRPRNPRSGLETLATKRRCRRKRRVAFPRQGLLQQRGNALHPPRATGLALLRQDPSKRVVLIPVSLAYLLPSYLKPRIPLNSRTLEEECLKSFESRLPATSLRRQHMRLGCPTRRRVLDKACIIPRQGVGLVELQSLSTRAEDGAAGAAEGGVERIDWSGKDRG